MPEVYDYYYDTFQKKEKIGLLFYYNYNVRTT